MPHHLISDAHEWINEIPTVPIYYLAKPQQREQTLHNQRGKCKKKERLQTSKWLLKRERFNFFLILFQKKLKIFYSWNTVYWS